MNDKFSPVPFSEQGLARLLVAVFAAPATGPQPSTGPSDPTPDVRRHTALAQTAALSEAVEEHLLARRLRERETACPELSALLSRLTLKPAR